MKATLPQHLFSALPICFLSYFIIGTIDTIQAKGISLMSTITYVVNATDDTDDGQCDATHCSFREAVSLSNTDGMLSEIHFDINGTAPHIILLGAGFPEMLDSLIIDGSTQPGWVLGDIVIDGTNGNGYLNGNWRFSPPTHNGGEHYIELYGIHVTNFTGGDSRYTGGVRLKNGIIGDVGRENIFTNNEKGIYVDDNSVHTDCVIKGNYFGVANGVSGTNGTTNYPPGAGIWMELSSFGAIIENNHFENEINGLFGGSMPSVTEVNNNTFINSGNGVWGNNGVLDVNNNSFEFLSGDGIYSYHELKADTNSFTNCSRGMWLEGVGPSFDLTGNTFISNNVGIDYKLDGGGNIWTMDGETFICNQSAIISDAAGFEIPPNISHTTQNIVHGMAVINDSPNVPTVEVYLVDDTLCPGSSTCQGSIPIGSGMTDPSGNFSITVDSLLSPGQRIAVRSQTSIGNGAYQFSTDFNCFIVQPDICETAKVLVVNPVDCATTGAVVDMEILTDSGQGIGSSCDGSYVGNDAWFKIESPDTWNSLVRVNINNAINGIAEAYIGTCGNLVLSQCIELDSVPFAMILDDFTPGTEVYIRVWDRDNTVVNTGTGALLHFTAHELDTLVENWEICDLENNLINGNPTILSERDANKFIVEYEMGATQAEMQVIRDSIIANGGTKVDSFVCGPQVLELWDHDNPVDMETNTRGTRRRTRVDTTNYNYVFEQLEFQLNAYADGEQYNSNTSMDDEGNFIVIWEDLERRNIFMRVYSSSGNPLTKELRVGSQNATQHNAQTELYNNGDFITTWHESNFSPQYSIFARLWNADGIPKGVPFNLSQMSAFLPGIGIGDASFGTDPSLASNSTDDFVVVWHHLNRIFFQRVDFSGNLIGGTEEVGVDILHGNDPDPKVDMNPSGDFVIVYNGIDNNGKGIFAQRYDSSGVELGTVIAVNTYTTGEQSGADVSMADDGSFIVSWHSDGQDGSDYGVYARRYDSNGTAIGGEISVNTYTADAQKDPTITQLDDGTFFIAWSSFGQDGFEEGIFGQFYDNTGATIGAEFQLNVLDDPEQENPSVSTNGSSIVLTTWEDGINDGDGKGIFGQRYEIIDAGGQKVFYPIGTATPSTLLGDELAYPGTIYTPQDSLSNVRVAIIDTGVDPEHPFLAGAMWNNQQAGAGCFPQDTLGYDFVNETYFPIDYDGHGTRVNGIIVRDFPPDIQLELMNLKFHEFQKGKVFDAVSAIYYAVDNGADIINMSWGFEASEFPAILQKAVQYASDNDVLLVTTAGNTSKNNDVINKYPCNFPIANMIKVTSYELNANTNERKLANYASFGQNNVDIAAHGFVESPTLGDTLGLSSGTSLAAPQVTRTAAIIKGLFPNLTAADIKDCILTTSQPEPDFANKVSTGGILDHDAAIDCAYDKAANCVAIDLYITLPQTADTTFRSDAWINTDASYSNGTDVELYGAEHVTMLPGFETILGGEYLADIDDCDPLNMPMTQTGGNNNAVLRLLEHSILTGKVKLQFYYGGDKVQINLKDESGKVIDTYNFEPETKGWYEKIINCKELKSGIYQVEINNEEDVNEVRYFQIYNLQYEKYQSHKPIYKE